MHAHCDFASRPQVCTADLLSTAAEVYYYLDLSDQGFALGVDICARRQLWAQYSYH